MPTHGSYSAWCLYNVDKLKKLKAITISIYKGRHHNIGRTLDMKQLPSPTQIEKSNRDVELTQTGCRRVLCSQLYTQCEQVAA